MFPYEKIRELNDLEMLVYNYMMENSERVVKMTIRELSNELHVSSTTILRFCTKMGFEGYSEFKYKFKEYLQKPLDNGMHIDVTIIQDFFVKASSKEFEKSLLQAAEIIHNKEKVFFIGLGTSGTLGKYGARYLSNLGKNALYLDDPFYPTDNGKYDDTAIVALSVSGEQRFLHKQIEGLKKGKATIISVTNTKQCTLANSSDHNISYYMPFILLPGMYNATTQIPVIYILESIAIQVQKLMHKT